MNDNSLMPFGKYKGEKLIDIPDQYFIWLYHELENKISINANELLLVEYIKDSFNENDLI